ncbi:DUF2141 domain-containing protein [Novosphingobium sp.]|uniref:DUF2141 domain-containing protein n=1 Tax=Novosphingobium sp. TaxID=1874826 RepID=UPI0038BAF8C5
MTFPMCKAVLMRAFAAMTIALVGLVATTPAVQAATPNCIGRASDTWIYISVDGVRNANGQIAATLYADDSSRFLVKNGSLYVARTPAVAGVTRFCLFVPHPAVYAIAIYHDEDNSGTINRGGLLGIPTEGFGFSNNPPTIASLPAFRSVRLNVSKPNLATTIHLSYP